MNTTTTAKEHAMTEHDDVLRHASEASIALSRLRRAIDTHPSNLTVTASLDLACDAVDLIAEEWRTSHPVPALSEAEPW